MKLEPDKRVKVLVTHSKCDYLKEGDTFFLNGPLIDIQKSSAICATALVGMYSYIMASRFGIESKNMEWDNGYHVWCQERLVEFTISNS